MSAFAHEEEGGDDNTLLSEEHVDESQLKLPSFKFDVTKAVAIKSGEDDEDVIFKE